MRTALLLVLAALGSAPAVVALPAELAPRVRPAQEEETVRLRAATEAEARAATTVIEAQLKAFRADDYALAEKLQHSALRRGFRSTAQFRDMMKRSYPQVAAYKTVTFGAARCTPDGERLEIPATVVGQDGITVRMIYALVREEGAYRVAGVEGGMPRRVPARDIA